MTSRIARYALPAVLCLTAGVGLIFALAVLGFDWELYVGESQNAFFADRLANDGELYFDWSDDELVFPVYGPVYFAVVAPVAWIAGSDIWGARLVSLFACLLVVGMTWHLVSRLGGTRVERLIASVGWISLPAGSVILFNARPDSVGIAFMMAGVVMTTKWDETRRDRDVVVAALFMTAMVMTRQNFLPIAIALLIVIALRSRRGGLLFAGVGALSGIALLVGVELMSSGAYLSSTSDFNAIGYSLASLRSFIDLVTLPLLDPIFAIAAVEALILFAAWRTAPIAGWAWIGALLVVLSALRVGSSDNYVLPLAVMSSVLFALALSRLREALGETGTALAMLAVALILAPSAIQAARKLPDSISHLSDLESANEEVVAQIEASPGPMFGDRADLSVATGNSLGLDAFNHTLMAEAGVWDPAPLAVRISSGEFGVIQTSFDAEATTGWAPELIEAIRSTYCEKFSTTVESPGQSIWLYEPCDGARAGS